MKYLSILVILFIQVNLYSGRKALVIGNQRYPENALRNTENDAMAMHQLLQKNGFKTTIKINLDRQSFEECIDSFTSTLDNTDEVLFYFSGHGVQIEGENYLIPTGRIFKDEKDVKYEAINANKLTEKLSLASLSIIVLDACRDNPFRGVKSMNRGLAPMGFKGGSQYIIYSTASGKTASDGRENLSPFTEAFIRSASIPGITIEDVMRRVVRDVRKFSEDTQIPFSYGSLDREFILTLTSADNYADRKPVPISNDRSVSDNMIYVRGGKYVPGTSTKHNDDPGAEVFVKSFLIGKYEVTQKEWGDTMNNNPSYWKGDNLPVEQVSWYETLAFCNYKSIKEGLLPVYSIDGSNVPDTWPVFKSTGDFHYSAKCDWNANGYRLPTEIEWEYAAKGGIYQNEYKYSGANELDQVGWYDLNSKDQTNNVGQKSPNKLGIYDMSGNVREWCWDWFVDEQGLSKGNSNLKSPEKGTKKVLRGGSWYCFEDSCRVTSRFSFYPDHISRTYGFRIVRSVNE